MRIRQKFWDWEFGYPLTVYWKVGASKEYYFRNQFSRQKFLQRVRKHPNFRSAWTFKT